MSDSCSGFAISGGGYKTKDRMGFDLNVLSLFDGISCGRVAIERAKIAINKYYASEVDKFAMKVSEKNYPDIMQLGDVEKWKDWDIPAPDLIMGGSPCQGFSFAGKQLAFDDPRSKLFFVFADILNHFKPKYFLLENVKMKKEYQDIISNILGVEPICINSSLVSAQNRVRYYWTNIPNIIQPNDKGFNLCDILADSTGVIKCVQHNKRVKVITENSRGYRPHRGDVKSTGISELGRILKPTGKTDCLTANHAPKVALNSDKTNLLYRKLTPIECERLQTLPDNYTKGVSDTQRYKMLGNGWTVDIIAHILRQIP